MIIDGENIAPIASIEAPMLRICGGVISLRDEGTKRHWTVEVNPFFMAKFTVTQEQYYLVMNSNAPVRGKHKTPVVDVSWNEAILFCNELSRKTGLTQCYSSAGDGETMCDWEANGYRIPTEAEWEYACRAGSNSSRYGELDNIAWYRDNAEQTVHEVGMKSPNKWGVHDMLGNVWEWCWDIFDKDVYGEYRVFRGGGWNDPPRGCRASCRRKSHPTFRIDDLGFRLARSLV